MRVTDTDSKGMIVVQSARGSYLAVSPQELADCMPELERVLKLRKSDGKREQIDARKY